MRLVLNQASRPGEGRAVRGQLQQVVDRFVTPQLPQPETAFKLELLGDLPIDPSVREAVQRRQLLLESQPGSPAAQAITAIATRLVDG